jgi:hypothetical protein
MAILATCTCGQTYDLKDEYAGRLMQCPQCGDHFEASSSAPAVVGDPVFARDKFLLRQKHFAISEKYFVWDEQGRTLLYVVRPAHLFRNVLAAFGGFAAGFIVLAAGIAAAGAIGDFLGEGIGAVCMILAFAGAAIAAIAVGATLSKKRNVLFYRDESQKELLLEVKQDQKFVLFNASFTLLDSAGQILGRFQKNYIYNIFRKRWRFF